MAGSVNKVILVGHCGYDPQIKDLQSGGKCAVISLATNERYKNKTTGEVKESTEWHRVVVYSSGVVDVCKDMVQKGTRLYIEGSIHTRKWHNNAGEDVYTTEILVRNFNDKIIILNNAKEREVPQEEPPVEQPTERADVKVIDVNDICEDIPF